MAKIITIDGPSGVGKGTAAQLIAEKYGFHLLDSGGLYRVVAVNALRLGLDHDNPADAVMAATDLAVVFKQGKTYLHGDDVTEEIRSLATGQLASKVAVHAEVRSRMFDFMQGFVEEPGIVADGRDMGTVVFPHADLKLFLMASAEERAKRRYKQLKSNGKDVSLAKVFSELEERDRRDREREVAPLEPAKDAVVIDTGPLEVEQVFEAIQVLVQDRDIVS